MHECTQATRMENGMKREGGKEAVVDERRNEGGKQWKGDGVVDVKAEEGQYVIRGEGWTHKKMDQRNKGGGEELEIKWDEKKKREYLQ